jgi:hypothetical protein
MGNVMLHNPAAFLSEYQYSWLSVTLTEQRQKAEQYHLCFSWIKGCVGWWYFSCWAHSDLARSAQTPNIRRVM